MRLTQFMSTDPVTQGIAIYAAVVSTVATISAISWEVVKWRRSNRPSVRVAATYSDRESLFQEKPPEFRLSVVNDGDFPIWLQSYTLITRKRRIWWERSFEAEKPVIEPHNSYTTSLDYNAEQQQRDNPLRFYILYNQDMTQKEVERCRIVVTLADGWSFRTKPCRKILEGSSHTPP